MTDDNLKRHQDVDLRDRAEERIGRYTPEYRADMSEDDIKALIHDLQVHQVELEMQNEELESARSQAQKQQDKYLDLYDFAPISYFTLDLQGTILSANLTSAELLGIDRYSLIGRRFQLFLHESSRITFTDFLKDVTETVEKRRVDATILTEDGRSIPIQIDATAAVDPVTGETQYRVAVADITERKRAEEVIAGRTRELELSNAELVDIDRYAPIGFGVMDTNLRYIRVNEQLAAMNGKPAADHIGKTMREMVPELADVLEPIFREAIDSGKPHPVFEISGFLPGETGSIRHYMANVYPIRTSNGEISGVSGIVQDITERKRMEESLRESEADLSAVFENTDDFFWCVGPVRFRISRFNDALKKHFAECYGTDVRIGMTPLEVLRCSEWADLWCALYERALREGSFNVEMKTVEGDRFFDFSLNTLKRNGQVSGISVVGRDISKRKHAEEALRESEERYRLIADNVSDYVCLCNKTGSVIYSSPSVKNMLGYEPEELVGINPFNLLHPDDVDARMEIYKAMLGDGEPPVVQLRCRAKDGSYVWLEAIAKRIRDESGQTVQFIMSCRDFTKRKQVEDAMRESDDRYRQFIANSSEGIWRYELEEPMPISLPVEEQIEFIAQRAYLAECNDVLARMYGLDKAEDIIGARIEDMMPRTEANTQYVLDFMQSYHLEERISEEFDVNGNLHYFRNSLNGIVEDGYLLRLWGTQVDVTEQKHWEEALKQQAALDALLNNISGIMLGCVPDKLKAAIEDSLKLVAKFFQVDRVYIAACQKDKSVVTEVYEHCEPGIPRFTHEILGAAVDCYSWSLKKLVAGEAIRINTLDDYPPEASNDRAASEHLGVKSYLSVILRGSSDSAASNIGLHTTAHERAWTEEDIRRLRIVADTLDIVIERKRAEDLLRESEANLSAVVESTDDFISTFDPIRFELMSFNGALKRYYSEKRSTDLRVGMPLDELHNPQTRENWREFFHRALHDGPFHTEYESSDGLVYDLSISLLRRGGQVFGISAFAKDITERRKAEEALRKSEANISAIVESTDDIICTFDSVRFDLLSFNSSLRRFCELHRGIDIHVGMSLEKFLASSEKLEIWRSYFQRALREGSFHLEYVLPGEPNVFDLSINLLRRDGQVFGISVFGKDITERRRAEEALRESERNYSALFANKTNAIAHCRTITDENGKPIDYMILKINEAYENIVGIKKEDIEGKLLTESFPGVENYSYDYIGNFGRIALEGGELSSEAFLEPTQQWLSMYAYSPSKGEFVVMFTDVTLHKQAQLALRESEDRYRTLFETMNEGFALCEIICDDCGKPCDWRYLQLNPAWEDNTGLAIDGVVGKTVRELLPHIEPYWIEEYGKVALTGQPARLENYVQDLDRYISVSAYSPAPGRFAAIFIDVTERRKSEEAIRRANAYNRSLIEASPDPLVTIGPDGKITDVNAATEAATGYGREQLIGTDFSDYFTEPDKSRAGYQQVFREGMVRDYALDLRHRNGSLTSVLYSASVYQDESGNVIGVFAAARDITQRKEAEEERQKVADEFRDLYNNAPCGYLSLDEDGTFVNINDALLSWLGYSRDEIIGKMKFSDIITPHTRDLFRHNFSLFKKQGSVRDIEHDLVRKDGTLLPVAASAVAVKDSSGKFVMGNATIYDITERKRSEKEREITVEFLRIVNISTETRSLIRAVTSFFQKQSGCEAIGVRFKDHDDYPYYEYRGFDKDFVLAENSLCDKDSAGEIVKDCDGYPIVECMCGNVIQGRFDPSKPFFTANGSFWTNNTTKLLATTTEADRQARTCDRCNGEGYESVALIPLSVGEQRFGLLQLNDRREGMFSADTISFWERLAGHLSVALAKFQTEQALAESEDRFRQMFHNISSGVVVYDAVGNGANFIIKEFNPAAELSFKMKRKDVVGKTLTEVIPGVEDLGLFQVLKQVWETGYPEYYPVDLYHDSKVPTWVENHIYKLPSGELMAIFDDVSERVRLEEERIQLEVQLRQQQKLESIGTLASGVAHEINNPIMGIMNYAELITFTAQAPVTEYAESIIHETERVATIVRNLLAFARHEQQEHNPVSMAETIDATLSLIRAILRHDQINLKLEIQHDLPLVDCHSQQIQQVLMNLISNARDSLNQKYEGYHEDKLITIRAALVSKDGRQWIRTVVKDHGVGVPPEIKNRLFDPFFTTKPTGVGTGLGLSISHGIIREHGGELGFESKLGKSTQFFFYLPVVKTPEDGLNE